MSKFRWYIIFDDMNVQGTNDADVVKALQEMETVIDTNTNKALGYGPKELDVEIPEYGTE